MIATDRRPTLLLKCLHGLETQTKAPDDVIIVIRDSDTETLNALAQRTPRSVVPIRIVMVSEPGLAAKRNKGISVCCTDVLAMIDDDAVPHSDWLSRIVGHFSKDPSLGGLGGRDRCYDGSKFDDRQAAVVGKLQWFGRGIGNHHLGFGEARVVDFIKGTNMSYRSEVFASMRFGSKLRGGWGAQPNEDMRFSLQVKTEGWKILYDPKVLVDHYQAARNEARFYGGIMPVSDITGFKDFAYNEVAAIWDILPRWRRVVFVVWSVLIGTRVSPGFIQAVRFTPRFGWQSWRRCLINLSGKFEAIGNLGWDYPQKEGSRRR